MNTNTPAIERALVRFMTALVNHDAHGRYTHAMETMDLVQDTPLWDNLTDAMVAMLNEYHRRQD
jgi:hypothetical protein